VLSSGLDGIVHSRSGVRIYDVAGVEAPAVRDAIGVVTEFLVCVAGLKPLPYVRSNSTPGG
jgi:hypothetical protein